MWTREIYDTGIPNLVVYLMRQGGVAKHYAIFPAEGFVIRVPNLDTVVETENGEMKTVRYISRGGGAEPLSYDWIKNGKGYAAICATEV